MSGVLFFRSLLCLSLIYLLNTNLFLAHFSGDTDNQDEDTRSYSPSNKLINFEKELSNTDSLSLNEDVLPDDDDNEDEDNATSKEKFSWQHHQDDHGIYSGRALLSTESISKHSSRLNEEDEDDVEDHAGAGESNLYDKSSSSSDSSSISSSSIRHEKIKNYDADQQDPLDTIDFAEREWQLMFRSFDLAYDTASSSILQEIGKQTDLFEQIVSRLRPQCRRDIYHIRDSARKHKLWALRMLDSNGKLPSGMTYGRYSSPGDYEECLSVQVDEEVYKDVTRKITEKYKFHGKYCLMDFRLPLPERPVGKLLSIHESVMDFNNTELGKQYPELIVKLSAYASAFYEVGYLHALCLPSSCDANELAKAMSKALEGTYLIVNNTIDCQERPVDQDEPLRQSQVISIVLLAAVFTNAFIASLAYYLINKTDIKRQRKLRKSSLAGRNDQRSTRPQATNHPNKNRNIRQLNDSEMSNNNDNDDDNKDAGKSTKQSLWKSIIGMTLQNQFYADCFSIQKNFERLTKPDPRGLTFVHYTRIVAMAFTVITHTGALGTLQAITKPADASNSEQIFRDLLPQMLANAFSTIQIFFFMAGFMLVLSTYPSIKRDKGHISFIEYAIKRAIRLLPGIAATICINFIWPLLVDGPMKKYFIRMILIPCETNWWHTLAFMSNFDHVEKICIRHSYFSASDYQLHIIAFPILVLLYTQPGLAIALATLLTVCGFVAQVIMILTKTIFPFILVDYIDKEAFFNVVHYIHHPVWNHMSAFFYGFIVGYAVVKQIRINISDTTIKRLWYTIAPAGIVSIFAPYFWNHYKRPIYKWQMVLYVIFDRLILLTTCAWISYATMVLARPKKPSQQVQAAQQKHINSKPTPQPSDDEATLADKKTSANIATFEHEIESRAAESTANKLLHPNTGSLTSLPRQRSSPNLASMNQKQQQQQQQQLQSHLVNIHLPPRRMSKAISSSNLETIDESSSKNNKLPNDRPQPQSNQQQQQQQQQAQRKRAPAQVSSINTLCLMLSRLTFQLYLFNMVVLWIDVSHSKYFWFFSYYFIIIKAAAVYICSAILAMIFFVALESPSLTLYIAWVRGRAAARAKQMDARAVAISSASGADTKYNQQAGLLNKLSGGAMVPTQSIVASDIAGNGGQNASGKPTFSFIDLSSSPTDLESASLGGGGGGGKIRRRQDCDMDQTRL